MAHIVSEPMPIEVFDGISYRVEFRLTPAPNDGIGVMWSADLIVDEGWSLTAAGRTAEAADALAELIVERSRPFPKED